MLAAERVLAVWEAAEPARGHARALALLDDAAGADLPLGRRDAALLDLFTAVRGPMLDALAECPECATTLELRLPVAELTAGDRDGGEHHDVDLGDGSVRVRCPTTADLIAAGATGGVEAARATLIARCTFDAGPLTDAQVKRLGDHLEQLDPLADVRIEIRCAECGHGWEALLDIPVLVWAQVQGVARRLLREVDALAARYGWSQAEILSMSQARRLAYLDLS